MADEYVPPEIPLIRADASYEKNEAYEGWKEATIAWAVCASLHREYCKRKDPFFTIRQEDFVRHENEARSKAIALKQR